MLNPPPSRRFPNFRPKSQDIIPTPKLKATVYDDSTVVLPLKLFKMMDVALQAINQRKAFILDGHDAAFVADENHIMKSLGEDNKRLRSKVHELEAELANTKIERNHYKEHIEKLRSHWIIKLFNL